MCKEPEIERAEGEREGGLCKQTSELKINRHRDGRPHTEKGVGNLTDLKSGNSRTNLEK